MDDKEIIKIEDTTLLDIFTSEEDRKGTDLLAMSNYFDVFIGKISTGVGEYSGWELYDDASSLIGQIATTIKGGFDISKLGMLAADTSHFSQDIADGLKSGLYHIGQSKEVAGNLRPAVLDSKEHLIKFVTLKKAIYPSVILEDISNLSMQASKLAGLSGPFRSLKEADAILTHINEDMQMIVRHEGVSK